MKKNILTLFLIFFLAKVSAQKIDTDSLLVEAIKEFDVKKNYKKAKKLSQQGYKLAPDYLDFQIELGKNYLQTKQADSARYFFGNVIQKNNKYKEAFSYLAQVELNDSKPDAALYVCEKALLLYPDDRKFYLLKLEILESIPKNDKPTFIYLKELLQKYPSDVALKLKLFTIKTKIKSDRFGVFYNITNISREGIGPIHLLGLQYIRERKDITMIGRVNFLDRYAFGKSTNKGLQYELESYFTNSEKSYSFASISVSNDNYVFAPFRAGYSYFYNFKKGWEGDLGLRYTRAGEKDFYAGVIGLGRYIDSYWLNLRTYIQKDKNNYYPSFALNTRYYYNTKYDYVALLAGYGTSPDERYSTGLVQQRTSLNSYRIGAGYYKLFWKNYFTGIQASFNKQEYAASNFQNEIDVFISLQYKLDKKKKEKKP